MKHTEPWKKNKKMKALTENAYKTYQMKALTESAYIKKLFQKMKALTFINKKKAFAFNLYTLAFCILIFLLFQVFL